MRGAGGFEPPPSKCDFRGLYPGKYTSYRLADMRIVFYALDYVYVHRFSFLALLLHKKICDFLKFFHFKPPLKSLYIFFLGGY